MTAQLPPPPATTWLHYLDRCDSTNTWAIANAAALQPGDVVFTRQQTAGRGQQGRVWYSPPGVLTASFFLSGVPTSCLPGFSLAAGLAVIFAIEDLATTLEGQLRLKWPNDLWLGDRKLAGILTEVTLSTAQKAQVVVGVGLNRCVDLSQIETEPGLSQRAISLDQIVQTLPDELSLLQRIRHHLLGAVGVVHQIGLAALLPELHRRDGLRDRQIGLDLGDRQITGIAAGLTASGELCLRLANNEIQSFSCGRVIQW
uniref:biotin--[biotin carboxyl-carrier protein] ligase n=1 Tax=Cyanothece sp. (strain PCC 7425 / ATCC 29141) TaxID=395961 RepID=B8HNZ3_CYAP4